MTLDLTAVYKKSTHVAFRKLDGNFYIVPSTRDYHGAEIIYYTLNEVAQEVWHRLDGNTTLKEIVDELLIIFDVDTDRLSADTQALLGDMEMKNVVIKVNQSDETSK